MVKIGPGELHVCTDPGEAIVTVLGSCVAACLRDPVAGVGGMNHFMLPEPGASGEGESNAWQGAEARWRYGSAAMEELLDRIRRHGGRLERMEAKLFGGARLGPDQGQVGESNMRFADQFLRRHGMVPLARELGGNWARRVVFHPASGRAFMTELRDPGPPAATRRGGKRAHQGSHHR